MKAVRINTYGGPDVVRIEDTPRLEPAKGQVLVRVRATAVNPIDWKIRQGYLPFLNLQLPVTLGCEIAGVVEQDSGAFRKGDEVYAFLVLTRNGGHAEYAIALENELALKPKSLDFIQASAVPVGALTSWQSLFDAGDLKSGQTVLIHGAAGGVASFAVQLAMWKGARVIGTASGPNLAYLRELGVDEAVDYRTERFEDKVSDVDLVFDTVGGDELERSFAVIRKGGALVSIAAHPSETKARERGIKAAFVNVLTNGGRLAEIAELVDAKKLRPRIDHVLPLSQAREALELSEKGHARGKIVLEVE
jgi:NADPH:quinone reductase-like Zn-dependent oxidoreductase